MRKLYAPIKKCCFSALALFFIGYGYSQTPTEQDCLGAIPICQPIYSQSTSPSGSGNYPNEINPAISCTVGELNSVWYTFTVAQSGNFGFLLTPNNLNDDYDWALFNITNADCEDIYTNPNLVASCNAAGGGTCNGLTGATGGTAYNNQGGGCNANPPSQNAGFSAFNALVPVTLGNTYVLMVSNWTGSQNGYTIDFGYSDVGVWGNNNPPVISGPISGPASVCPGAPFNYSVNQAIGASNYNWTLSPAIGSISNNGSSNISVIFASPGAAQLCVTPSNPCITGPPVCMTIISTPIPPTVIPVLYCFGSAWTCQGQTFTTPGQQIFTYSSWQGCDSLVTCIGTPILPTVMPPFSATICEGETYNFAGQTYDMTGGYQVALTGANGCDSVVTLVLSVLEAEAIIQAPPLLGCGGGATIVLSGSGSTSQPSTAGGVLSYLWTGPGIVGPNNQLNATVNQGGTYTLTVTQTANGVSCSDQASVMVMMDTEAPQQPTLSGALNACTGNSASYTATASSSGPAPAGFSWTVSGGTLSGSGTSVSVTWDTPGQGEICVTADNACGTSPQACLSVEVGQAPAVPALLGPDVACVGGVFFFSINSSDPNTLSYVWTVSGNASFTGMGDSIEVVFTGVPGAQVCVAGSNDCGQSQQVCIDVAVSDVPAQPLVSGAAAVCAGETASYSVEPDSGASGFVWTAGPGGTIVAGQGSASVQIEWTGAGGQVCVRAENGCGLSEEACFAVAVNAPPQASNIEVECNGAGDAYAVSFTISGGDPASYTVNGSGAGISAGPPYVFTSEEIPAGTGYNFVLDDANQCAPFTVSQAFVICDCLSETGDMDPTPQSACGDDCITAIYDADGEFQDADDALQFILHTGAALSIVNEIVRNDAPIFCFDEGAGMSYGTTYYISAVVGNDQGGGVVDLGDPCLSVAQGTPVVFYQEPEAMLSGDATICIGNSATLTVDFTAPAPYTLTYADGVGVLVLAGITDNPLFLTVSPTATETWSLISVSNANCSGQAHGLATVTVNEEVAVTNVLTACDATNTEYVVTFTVSGGDPATYEVTPLGAGMLDAGPPAVYTSNPLATGSPYAFQVTDANACAVVDVQSGPVTCECASATGQMGQNLLEICGDGPAIAAYDPAGETFDGNDVLEFILHNGSGDAIGYPIIARSATPSFGFDAGLGMSYNTVYYISAIVGSNDGAGGVDDLNDPCLAVAAGTPVVFHEIPTATLSGDQSICVGDNAAFAVAFTGNAPWTIIVSDGAAMLEVENINDANHIFTAPPLVSATYTIVAISDAHCSGTAAGSAIVTVNGSPSASNSTVTINATNTFATVCFDISGGDPASWSVTGGPGAIVGNQFCSDPIPCGQGSYQFFLQDANGCDIVAVQGPINCPCTSEAGVMSQPPQFVCQYETVGVPPATGVQLDGDDVLMYALHTNSGASLGTVVATSPSPAFAFDPATMACETNYYISAVVGSDDGGGQPDINDPCLSVAPGTPVVFQCLPTATISGGGAICLGGSAQVVFSLSGTGPFNVVVNDGVQDISLTNISNGYSWMVSPSQTSVYTLVGVQSAATGCLNTASATVSVTVNNPVSAGAASAPAAFCAGESQLLGLAGLLSGQDGGGVWAEVSATPSTGGAFNAAAGTFNTMGQAAGIYVFRYTVSGTAPCPNDSENVTVNINPLPSADAGPAQLLTCNASAATIGGPGTSLGAEYSYAWTLPGSASVIGTQPALSVSQAGVYELTVTNTQTGCASSAQTTVSQDVETPQAVVEVKDVSCQGEADGEILLASVTGGKPPYMFSLNGGPYGAQQQFFNLGGGVYLVSIQDANGCETTVQASITEPPMLTAAISANIAPDLQGNYVVEWGDHVVLTLTSSYPPGNLDTIIWSPFDQLVCSDAFCASVTVAPQDEMVVTVLVESGPCSAASQVRLLVRKVRNVFIPNIFSPNFDGLNDVFYIQAGPQVREVRQLLVFDRWGEPVFQAQNFPPNATAFGWDGTRRGKRANAGVYAWFAEIEFLDGHVETFKGDVTLIR